MIGVALTWKILIFILPPFQLELPGHKLLKCGRCGSAFVAARYRSARIPFRLNGQATIALGEPDRFTFITWVSPPQLMPSGEYVYQRLLSPTSPLPPFPL
jgi:hypothetical protein